MDPAGEHDPTLTSSGGGLGRGPSAYATPGGGAPAYAPPAARAAASAALGAPAATPAPTEVATLEDPSLYINRELSWLDFNDRVLQLAEDERVPLLERLKFLAIYTSHPDEFFMVRGAGG